MPTLKASYLLPLLYAILGGILWQNYGVRPVELLMWIGLQLLLLGAYVWLIGGGNHGLLMKFHLITTGIGMLMLFFVLMPWRPEQDAAHILFELIIMGVGTFLCALGLYTLLYLIVRKFIFNWRGKGSADQA